MLVNSKCSSFFILIFNFIFNRSLYVQTSSLRRFVRVPLKMTWHEAQSYCREYYVDLATIRDVNETTREMCRYSSRCWIGLKRDINDSSVWNWSNGEENIFQNWKVDLKEPRYHSGQDCASTGWEYWFSTPCSHKMDFVCYNDLVLVKVNKTWEEALEHCINLDTDPDPDSNFILPHMDFEGNNLVGRKAIVDAQTEEVWIGLRFLAGYWLWVNGMPLQKQLPACPAPGRYCGTMSKTGEIVPDRDCLERRNFFVLRKKQDNL